MLGHDVLTNHEAGRSGQAIPDDQVLAFATAGGRAVVTINKRDFVRLHKEAPVHAGIIVCTQDTDSEGQAMRISDAIAEAGSIAGMLLRVNRPQRPGPTSPT